MKIDEVLNIRQTLFENVEYMLEKVNSYKAETKSNSFDLFDLDDESVTEKLELKPPLKLNKLNVLLKEKEFLGLYVTDNPIEQFTPFLNYLKNLTGKDNIYLILIDKIKKIFTRNKDMMFGIELSIDGEKVEGIIFPKNAMALSPIMEEKELYFVLGKISQPKKRKVIEVAETDFDSEDGNQVQEFVELPKLIIENLVPFKDGLKDLFVKDEDKITKTRTEILEKIDFVSIFDNPEDYLTFLNNPNDEIEKKEVRIDLPNTLDKLKAIEIKNILSTDKNQEIIINLYVQLPNGDYKKAKSNFTVNQENLIKINTLLQ
jgi:DNA polymerase III alpha subunit